MEATHSLSQGLQTVCDGMESPRSLEGCSVRFEFTCWSNGWTLMKPKSTLSSKRTWESSVSRMPISTRPLSDVPMRPPSKRGRVLRSQISVSPRLTFASGWEFKLLRSEVHPNLAAKPRTQIPRRSATARRSRRRQENMGRITVSRWRMPSEILSPTCYRHKPCRGPLPAWIECA